MYSYTNIPPDQLKFSTGKEVLVPRVGEEPLDFASCSWLSLPDIAIGEMISVYNTDHNPLFVANYFNTLLRKAFAEKVEGGNVSNLYFHRLVDIPVSFPSIAEQETIANFCDKLSSVITLHKRKLDGLKKLKNGYLQKMFPQSGESVPRLRFGMFSDGWTIRKLGNVVERVQGNDGQMDLPTLTISAGSGWLDQRDRFSSNIAGKEQENYTLLSKGELSYNKGNSKLAKYGVVFELKTHDKALVPRVYHSFRTTQEANATFLEYMFATKIPDSELAKLITSGARMDGLLQQFHLLFRHYF